MLMRGKPNMPAYWPNGDPGPDIEYGYNPAVTATNATGYDDDKIYVLQSNLRMNISIPWVKGLTVTGNASIDKNFDFRKKFETPWYLYTWNGDINNPVTTAGKRGLDSPQLTEESRDGYRITYNVYGTYETSLGGAHDIKVMAGTERQQGYNDYLYAFRKNYISSAVDQLFAGANDTYMSNTGTAGQNARMNYFGRVNYAYKQRYLAEFVWRYDGSYMFPKGKQFGFFPGISLGWRVSEEDFWKNNIPSINNFKLRASWGQTGNDRISEYQYLSSYSILANKSYVFDVNKESKMLYESRIPNPEVTWEVANKSDIGFEALILNRLTFEADYFYNLRTSILWKKNASVPASAGLTLPPQNISKVATSGFDFMVAYRGKVGKLAYDVSVNGGYAKNKIKFWDEVPGRPEYQQSTGKPIPTDPHNINSDLYYQAIGIFQTTADTAGVPHWSGARGGDIIFADVNKDGHIDGLDRVRSDKNNLPRFTGGFNVNLQYGLFDLSMLIQGASGAQIYINPESGEIGNFLKEFADNRWTEEKHSTSTPRTFNRGEEYWQANANTWWLQKTDYIRLKSLEIGVNLPSNINKKIGIVGLRVYVSGTNLLTWSTLKIYDPELDTGSGQVYPLQKVINFGASLTF
jgi:TonB-linked SusC/RagA family outer membrane protein